jgi:hypothetical protein
MSAGGNQLQAWHDDAERLLTEALKAGHFEFDKIAKALAEGGIDPAGEERIRSKASA